MQKVHIHFFPYDVSTLKHAILLCSGIQREHEQHNKYQQARMDFMDKAFVGEGETPIERDLKEKFHEVDMLVSRTCTCM